MALSDELKSFLAAEFAKQQAEMQCYQQQINTMGEEVMKLKTNVNFLENSDVSSHNRSGFVQRKEDDIKLQDLPKFDGELDAEVYLDWERRIERIFTQKKLDDGKRFDFAILKLSRYASSYFESLQYKREREQKP